MLLWKPSRHWIHLLNSVGLEQRDLKTYPYHISICYVADLLADYGKKRHELYKLRDKYGSEKDVVISVSSFGSGGSAVITVGSELHNDLYPLWSKGGESYKSGLHISL